jgi:hypothetical protein
MPEIARLDEQGMLIGVEECSDDDHKTCPIARTVKLEGKHDVRQLLRRYRWDFGRQCFLPLSAEPLDVAERDTSELVEGLVEALEHIEEKLKIDWPKRTKRVLKEFRRHTPRRKEQQVELIVSGENSPAGEDGA